MKATKKKEKTMATILDGKLTSAKVKEEVAAKIAAACADGRTPPCLAVVIVGDNPASKVYVANKKKACEAVGIRSLSYELPGETSQEELLALVDRLNADAAVNGILVQLPLPGHIDEQTVIERISPAKDVDAFHPSNVGRIMLGLDGFAPCTPAGIMRLLAEYGISAAGKNCVVVGRSNIVGKPMALLLLKANGTVSVCHSKTAVFGFSYEAGGHPGRSHRAREVHHCGYGGGRRGHRRCRYEPGRRYACWRCGF